MDRSYDMVEVWAELDSEFARITEAADYSAADLRVQVYRSLAEWDRCDADIAAAVGAAAERYEAWLEASCPF